MFSSGLAEIVLVVKDVKASAEFYRDIVGLTPASEATEKWAWFWAGGVGQDQRLALAKDTLLFEEKSPRPEGRRWGQVHYALNITRAKLPEAVQHVRQKGVEVYGPIEFKWMKAIAYYFYDPDGNLIEFWSRDKD